MLPKSSLWLLSLMLFISACNPNPQQAPQNQAPQEQATPIPNPVTSQYVAAVAGVTFLQPIGDYYRIHENLDPAIDLHVEAFFLKDDKPSGAALGLDLSRHNHKIQVSNNFLFKEYRTRWHIRDFDIPEGSLIRLEVRNNRAKHGEAACHDNKATLNTGCLGFVDLAVYPRQWYARVLTDYPEVAAEEQGNAELVTQAKDTFLAEERAFAENYAAEDTIDIAQLVAQEITGQGFFDDTRAGKSIILWGGSLHLRFHVTRGANNSPPQINIQAPTLDNFTSNEKIVLAAQATDLEDGDISNNITWSSSIDGALGTGAQLLKKLSVGRHTLTAQVADSGAKTATTTYNVTIIDSNTIPAMPDGWEATIVPNDPATGTGVVIPLENEATNEATNNAAASINTANTTTTPRRFLLRGYDSQVFLSQALTNDNSEVKACFDTTKLAANAYVSLGASQNINPDINPDGLATPWAKAIATGKMLPQAKSDGTEASNGTIAKAVCFVARKSRGDIKIFESSATTFTAASTDTLTLIQSYPISLSAPYRLFASLSTPANNQTSPTTIANNQAIVTIAITHLPDDVPVDPEDDPNTETVEASVSVDIDLGIVKNEFLFDALASRGTDLAYLWDFGDGKTSTKGFVYHVYDTPGEYTVKLTITNSVGRTNVIEQKVYILPTIEQFIPALDKHRSIKFNPSNGGRSVTFNLGTLFAGFRYEVDFGDGSDRVIRRQGQDSSITHSYPLGTYTYSIKVYDERAQGAQRAIYPESRAQQDATLLVEDSTWFTLWSDAPKAKFTMSNPNDTTEISADGQSGTSDENGDFFGNIPLTINFNATSSQAPRNNPSAALHYRWEFGDGSAAQEGSTAQVSHTFTETGFYLITLTVTDKDTGLSDTYQAFVKAKAPIHDTLISVIYPESQLATASFFDYQGHFVTEDDINLQQSTTIPVFKDHFPYVMVFDPATNRDNMALIVRQKHNPFFCNPVANNYDYDRYYNVVFNNGQSNVPVTNNYYVSTFKPYNIHNPSQGGLCVQWQNKFRKLNPFIRPANNTLGIKTPSQDFRNEIDSIAGLRVPRVYVSVLPDSMIDGSLPSPNLVEKRTQNTATGKEELILIAQIRESDIDRFKRNLTFDVPAYGVDSQGRMVKANGYFHADIVGEQSDCGDCVMVDGRTTISLTVPLPRQGKPEATFNLSRIQVSRDGTCGFDKHTDLNMFLGKCITVTTSHEVPSNAPSNIKPFDYPITITASANGNSNRITILSRLTNPVDFITDTVNSTFKWLNDLSFRDVGIFVYNLVPFLSDGVDLLNQLRITYLTDKEADIVIVTFASVGLILDATTGGLLDVTAFFKSAYKVSLDIARRQGGGALSKIFRDEITNLLAGVISPTELMTRMKNTFGQVVTVGKACGLTGAVRCFGQLDISVTQLAGLENVDFKVAADRFDDGLQAAKRGNLSPQCFLAASSTLSNVYDPTNMLMWFFDIDATQTERANSQFLEPLAASSSRGACDDYRTTKMGDYKSKGNEAWRREFETSNPSSNIMSEVKGKFFEVHHMVPTKDGRRGFCKPRNSTLTVSLCGESRRIMEEFDINNNAPANLIPLPLPGATGRDGKPTKIPLFMKSYPNVTAHDRKSNSGGPHSLQFNTEVHRRLSSIEEEFKNDAQRPTANVPELRKFYRTKIILELRLIGLKLLAGGTFK